jgi:hypothetical protein
MVGDLAHIARCLDLQEQDIVDAIGTREHTRALLLHLEGLSAPNTGVAKALLVLARLGTMVCEWIDGDLTVELTREDEVTRVDVSTELGGGLRERVFSPLRFKAPLAEFARAIERVPHMIAPLGVRSSTPNRIVLSATEATRRTSFPPPPIEISTESLFLPPSSPTPPQVVLPEDDAAPLPVVTPATPRAPSEALLNDVDSGWDD